MLPRPRRSADFDGLASYYADSLAGHRTANGERYDPRALTAAHRTLPFGTQLRVTRVDTRKSVVVRVNDRGPFGDSRRVLDLSRAAARRLDMLGAGVVRVHVEFMNPAEPIGD
jgi:rare lipoprotein A